MQSVQGCVWSVKKLLGTGANAQLICPLTAPQKWRRRKLTAPQEVWSIQLSMSRFPKKLGKYRLKRRIAEGQFARVYEAYDTIEGLNVALKIPIDQEPSHRSDLAKEVRLTVQLHNAHILPVKSAGIEDETFVIAYPLGTESLADRLSRRLAHKSALSISEDLLDAVAFAHSKRIVHRDIKPENVILFEDGRACLADFGIAKFAPNTLTASYDGTGTYGYMAPEHALGRATFRSDVFALGLVIWRILGGALPQWPFTWPPEGLARIRRNYGSGVVEVLKKALTLDDRRRYANAGAMQVAFKRVTRLAPVARKEKEPQDKRRPSNSWRATRLKEFKRAVKKELGAIGECASCAGPVAEAMTYCPWCSVSIDWNQGPSLLASRCKRCHRGVKSDWTYCAYCYGGRIRLESAVLRSDSRYVRRCGKCGEKSLLPGAKYCPVCRAKPKPAKLTTTDASTCRHCGVSVLAGSWDYCPCCAKPCAKLLKVNKKL
ncbi:MAG: hypothetical protein RJA70_157 [Pseudomonadota bacterium]|jgi:serine/threonine-protein kinase